MTIVTRNLPLNGAFRTVNNCRCRYRLLLGSAGSGKSVNLASDYIARLSDVRYAGANLLVVRKLESAHRDSTFAELEAAVIRLFGQDWPLFWRICRNPLSLTSLVTGARIIFRGLKDPGQREKVKSISFPQGKLTWIWIEEATELEPADLDILDDRLRGQLLNPQLYYQITMSFNPVSASHWLKSRYFDRPAPEVFCHHSTFRDNRFLDPGYADRMERRRREDPEGYRVYGLGLWGEREGLILPSFSVQDCSSLPEDYDAFFYGQDFGFNHANVLVAVGWRDGELFLTDELYLRGCDTAEIIARARADGWRQSVEMFCDSAEPDRIRTWQQAGWLARPVKKEPGSVKAQIDWLKSHRLHVDPHCVNALRELAGWRWRQDQNGLWLDLPLERSDDVMAALRYSVERLRRGQQQRGISVFK